jgi:hypothetical protein
LYEGSFMAKGTITNKLIAAHLLEGRTVRRVPAFADVLRLLADRRRRVPLRLSRDLRRPRTRASIHDAIERVALARRRPRVQVRDRGHGRRARVTGASTSRRERDSRRRHCESDESPVRHPIASDRERQVSIRTEPPSRRTTDACAVSSLESR